MEKNTEYEDPEKTSNEIQLYIYDLSRGYAQTFLSKILGKEILGIWHSSIVAYGREYFYGGNGIESCDPGTTYLGEPQQIIQLGVTEIPYSLFLEYIFGLGSSKYAIGTYNLFNFNCNNFTNEVANFLFGKGIPKEICELPNEILKTSLGQILSSFLTSFNIRPNGKGAQLSSKKNNQMISEKELNNSTDKNQDNLPSTSSKKKIYKYSDPLIIYKDVNGPNVYEKLKNLVNDQLNPEEQVILKEWGDFIINDNGGWSLGDEHLILFRKLLDNNNNIFKEEVTKLVLNVLQDSALKDGFVLLLHEDRKDHRLMSFLNTIENLELYLQEEICILITNLCSLPSSFDWLMYISEWIDENGFSCNNCKVTTRIAVHCLLHEKTKKIQKLGLNLIWNIALRDVFENTAIELATALFEYLNNDLSEENANLALTSLLRFILISPTDISMLAKILAPNFEKFKSEKNNKLIDDINLKLSC